MFRVCLDCTVRELFTSTGSKSDFDGHGNCFNIAELVLFARYWKPLLCMTPKSTLPLTIALGGYRDGL